MALRKVLLLTYHFPPSGAVAVYRMLGLVRYLPKFGWQPVVVAPPQVPWEPADASLLEQVPPGTPVERVPFLDGFVGKVVRKVAPEAHWIVKARSACRRMIAEHQPDAVISSSPPGMVHLLGRWVQKRYGLPWIACFRDPWITNRRERTWYWRFERRMEGMVMMHASQLVANTPRNLEGWRNEYGEQASKMTVITNGFDPERFVPTIHAKLIGGRLTMLHAGELYAGRDPRPFLDALQQLHAESPSACPAVEFLGRITEQAYDFEVELQKRGLVGAVTRQGQVPYEVSLSKMMSSDILFLFQTPGYRLGIPAKLYEYLGAGRPVLAISELDSDIAWLLRESRVLHRVAAPMDVAGIKQALRELMSEVRAGRPAAPDRDAVLQFTRERMAQRFAECLDRIVPAGTASLPLTASVTP